MNLVEIGITRWILVVAALAACGEAPRAGISDAAVTDGANGLDSAAPACALVADTAATSTANNQGCNLLHRDTGACKAQRVASGLSGYWLQFSCRVALTTTGVAKLVEARSDGQPDYKSFYFPSASPCHESYPGGTHNPNDIATQSLTVDFPLAPDTMTAPMRGAIVGLAVNGVPLFGNFAAPGDDIYREAVSFDRCGGHPQMSGMYHYHTEPAAISYNDANLIGVLRDGYPLYGRKDVDGSLPTTLDGYGGHIAVTADSPATPVYHYHANLQVSTNAGTLGQSQWFLTKGDYRGSPAPCGSCN